MKAAAVIACVSLTYLVFARIQDKVTYNGAQLWQITIHNKTAFKLLTSLARKKYLTLWGMNATKVEAMVHAGSAQKVRKKLLENNLKYEVMMEDVQRAIDEENLKPEIEFGRHQDHRLTWTYYHNLDDIYDYLRYLSQTFPKFCTIQTIGNSSEGRPIKLLRISNGKSKNRAIFIEGGIHAREWISPSAVTYIIHRFITDYENQPSFIKNTDWYFVPVLNPDGYEYSHNIDRLWRKNRSKSSKNCTGVDLNRNWGYDWGKKGSSDNPCSNSYRGRKPFSEPETVSVANFFTNNPNISWVGYVAIHSYGQLIIYPWGSRNAVLEDHEELNKIGTEAATKIVDAGGEPYTVGSVGATIYAASGASVDWARGAEAVKYSFTIELRDRGRYGFILPSKFIKATSEDALILVNTIAEAAAQAAQKLK